MGGIVDAIFGGGDSPQAPAPDPLIGQAAGLNAETQKRMADLAEEQWAYTKAKNAENAPYYDKARDIAIGTAQDNRDRSTQQWDAYNTTFKPLETKMANDALNFDTAGERDNAAGRAVQDVNSQFDIANATADRNLMRAGVNPASGRAAGVERAGELAKAGAAAGAATGARDKIRTLGMSLVENAAKFGRNMPSTGLAADSAALSGTGASNSTLASQANVANSGANTVANLYGGSVSAGNSAGNLLNGQFQQQNAAYGNALQANRDAWSGAGDLAAAAIKYGPTVAGFFGFKDGGEVRRRPRMLGYAKGGEIEGPGTGTSDSIPATIEGEEPAALSDGEFVVKADTTQNVYGPETLHDVNDGKAEIITSDMLEQIGRNHIRSIVQAMAKPRRAPVTLEHAEV